MYSDYMIKNSKMQMFVKSVLSQLAEAEVKTTNKLKAEILNFIKEFVKSSNIKAQNLKKTYKVPLNLPYRETDYLKEDDADKIIKNLESVKIAKNNIERALNSYLTDKNLKALKSALLVIGNTPKFEYAWSLIQGNLQAPAKFAFIHFLKKYYDILIPVDYTGIDRDPKVAEALRNEKIYPSYPLHLLNRFIELQVLAEMIKAGKVDSNMEKEMLSAILSSSDIRNDVIKYVKSNKDGDFDAEVSKPIRHLDIETIPTQLKHSADPFGSEHAKQQRTDIGVRGKI